MTDSAEFIRVLCRKFGVPYLRDDAEAVLGSAVGIVPGANRALYACTDTAREHIIKQEKLEGNIVMSVADLITQYIEQDPQRRGPARARLRHVGVEVWALVAQLPGVDGDVERLATAYGLPCEAVEAALAYYACHKDVIDAQITVNAA